MTLHVQRCHIKKSKKREKFEIIICHAHFKIIVKVTLNFCEIWWIYGDKDYVCNNARKTLNLSWYLMFQKSNWSLFAIYLGMKMRGGFCGVLVEIIN